MQVNFMGNIDYYAPLEKKISYDEFLKRTHFTQAELLAFGYGRLVQDPPSDFAKLPIPPMLMMDRVTEVARNGKKGRIVAEKDIKIDEWFFQCHFIGDPVQPGVLGVDAIWQLIGFYCTLNGAEGSGRALGSGEIEFFGQIRPYNKVVRYEIDIRRYSELTEKGIVMAVGNAAVFVDGEQVYSMKDARVGIFKDMAYPDYPVKSKNSIGGMIARG